MDFAFIQKASMSKCAEPVAARARLALSSTVRVEKARAGATWGRTWTAEGQERSRQRVLKNLLTKAEQVRAEFWTSDEGKAVYNLIHAPGADLGFDAAVEQLEELSPGWIDEQLTALGGNVVKSDTAIGKIEAKAVEIQKAQKDMTIEAARAEAWKKYPGLYAQHKRERGAYIRANK